jgi:NitT/TauT family transport system permease protein
MASIQQDSQGQATLGRTDRPGLPSSVKWILDLIPSLAVMALVVVVWELVARSGWIQAFILPAPGTVFSSLIDLTKDGTLPSNAAVTLEEAGAGLTIALLIALPLGYSLAHLRPLERIFAPLLAASQAIPIVAIAPLLVLLVEPGLRVKIIVSAVIAVFPLTVNTVTAIRGVAREYLEVARVFGVPWWERVLRVEMPLSAPVLLAGLKLGVVLAMTGAVVGEFVAPDQGLGFLLNYYKETYYAAGSFATLLVLVFISITLFAFVSVLEGMVARWQG